MLLFALCCLEHYSIRQFSAKEDCLSLLLSKRQVKEYLPYVANNGNIFTNTENHGFS